MSNGFLTEIQAYDVLANRPAAAAAIEGYCYHASDEGITYRCNGSSWDDIAVNETGHAGIDHTGLTGVGGSGGGIVGYDEEIRTAGDLSVSSTSAGAAIPTLPTLSVPASAGDLLQVGLSAAISADTESMRLDVGTIVSAAVVNYFSSRSSSPATTGIGAWGISVTTEQRRGPVVFYVVQAGDISGGNVELGLRAWLSSGTSRVVQATSGVPLHFWCVNLGQ